jgi:hypothetical protein
MSSGRMDIALSNAWQFTNALFNDLLLYPASNSQRVVIGTHAGNPAALVVGSNSVALQGGLALQGDVLLEGLIGSKTSGSTLDIGSDANTSAMSIGCGPGAQTLNIGTGAGVTTINLGSAGDTINAAALTTGGAITSTLAMGSEPFVVASSNQVANLNASFLAGKGSNFYLDVSNATAGTLAVARGGTGTTTATGTGSVVLSSNATLTGTTTAGTVNASALQINGSNLSTLFAASNIDAAVITTGTLPVPRGGTGTTTATGTGSVVLSSNATLTGSTTAGTITAESLTASGTVTSCNINFTGQLLQNGVPYIGSQFSNNSSNVFLLGGSNLGIGTSSPNPEWSLDTTRDLNTASNVRTGGVVRLDNAGNLSNVGSLTLGGAVASSSASSTMNVGCDGNTSVLALGCGSGAQTVNVGTGAGATTINLGGAGDTVNIAGTLTYINATNIQVVDKLITLNKGGATATAGGTGMEFEESSAITGYIKTSSGRSGYIFRAPASASTAPDFQLDMPASNVTTFNGSQLTLSNGLVGVGTSTPGFALDVASGDVNSASNLRTGGVVRLDNAGNLSNIASLTASGAVSASNINFTGQLLQNGSPYIGSQFINASSNVYLLGGSNLGIGKSNPAYALDVVGDVSASNLRTGGVVRLDNAGNLSNIVSMTASGAVSASNINFTGQLLQNGAPYVGSQFSNTSSNVFLMGSNLGLGTSNPAFTLDVNGTVNATDVVMRSDSRLKTNLEKISQGLDKIKSISGYTYNLRADLEGKRYTGLIAQELEVVLPEAVTTDDNGIKSVAYGSLAGLIVEAIKDLDAKIDRLLA